MSLMVRWQNGHLSLHHEPDRIKEHQGKPAREECLVGLALIIKKPQVLWVKNMYILFVNLEALMVESLRSQKQHLQKNVNVQSRRELSSHTHTDLSGKTYQPTNNPPNPQFFVFSSNNQHSSFLMCIPFIFMIISYLYYGIPIIIFLYIFNLMKAGPQSDS